MSDDDEQPWSPNQQDRATYYGKTSHRMQNKNLGGTPDLTHWLADCLDQVIVLQHTSSAQIQLQESARMRIKRLLTAILLSLALVMPSLAQRGGHGHSSSHSSKSHSHSSKKSHVPGSNDGTYQGGTGSSHKGGHYKNKKTDDHYRDREGGTPR